MHKYFFHSSLFYEFIGKLLLNVLYGVLFLNLKKVIVIYYEKSEG